MWLTNGPDGLIGGGSHHIRSLNTTFKKTSIVIIYISCLILQITVDFKITLHHQHGQQMVPMGRTLRLIAPLGNVILKWGVLCKTRDINDTIGCFYSGFIGLLVDVKSWEPPMDRTLRRITQLPVKPRELLVKQGRHRRVGCIFYFVTTLYCH